MHKSHVLQYKNMPLKMDDGQGLPNNGFRKFLAFPVGIRAFLLSALLATCKFGSLARKLRFHKFNLQFLKGSRTNASFSQLQLAVFEGCLARKLCFATSTCTF